MDTYEAITYSLYTNTKDLSYKNGIHIYRGVTPCDGPGPVHISISVEPPSYTFLAVECTIYKYNPF